MTNEKKTTTQSTLVVRARATLGHAAGLAALAVAALTLLLFASSAQAELLQPGGFTVTTTTSEAGAHPDLTTNLAFAADSQGVVSEHDKDVVVDLPAGFVGEPAGVPACPLETFSSNVSNLNETCPADTIIGTATVTATSSPGTTITEQAPVINIVPDTGQVAKFAFSVAGLYGIQMVASVRPGDYGVRTTVRNTSSLLDLDAVSLTLWGVPADPSHDPQRGQWCFTFPGSSESCYEGGLSAGSLPKPFLTNPTQCGVSLTATLHADSWEHQASFNSDDSPDLSDPNWQTATYNMPPITGCDQLSFQPTLTVQPTETTADSPTGLVADLKVPQNNDPNGLATAELRKAVVTLPAGVVLSPPEADGLADCSDAEVGLDSNDPPGCPLASTIGTATLKTPALPDELTGNIYLAGPDSGSITGPPYRIFLTLSGDGVMVKLQGSVVPDPVTGQLTTTFDDNPQLPFSELTLDFKSGPRAPLATPESCGTYTTTSDLEPWSAPDSGVDATPSDSFTINSGCVSGFSPTFTAGVMNAQAGAFSPFVLSFARSDTDQELSGLSVKLPPGILAKLAGVQECTDAQLAQAAVSTGAQEQASPSCPAGSQVGTVETGSGAGSSPFFLSGKAYLTGPYKGAPYGLAVIVPAVAGPFDLGTVVVRQALYIDPTTAQVTDVSDPFPTILKGIPLRLRRVDVDLNRPDFIVNPTNCNAMSVTGTLSSTLGISAPVSSRFQVGGCAALRFSPKLRMKLTGEGRTRSGDHPTLVATVTQRGGQANIHNVRVALPLSLALDPNNSQHVCSYAVAQAVTTGPANCPASTLVGHATAVTPLLSKPLTGPVYLVQGIRMQNGVQIHTLPSLLIPLRGQIALDLRAQTSVSGGKLVSTFATIPDAAVSRFTLTINGGHKGILVITGRGRSICGSPQVTRAALVGQNGKAVYPNVKMGTPCRVVHHKKARRHRKHSVRRSHRG